ncbi:hypothetical protein LguiA_022725 [Lonicera macranthoides]
MIQFLFAVLLVEAALILFLFFKTDIRDPLLQTLDALKQGKGPLILKTFAVFFLAVLLSGVYCVFKIRHRSIQAGSIDLTDQVVLSEKLLQASLAGILLFLCVVIDRLHQLIREEASLKNVIKAENKQLEKRKIHIDTQLEAFQREIAKLKPKIAVLEHEHQTKTDKAMAAELTVSSLKEKAETLYIEYDRLLDYNQTLRNQLQSIDEVLLKDDQTKGLSTLRSNESSREVVGFENELVTSSRCDRVLFSGSSPTSSPRHRKPIYQH